MMRRSIVGILSLGLAACGGSSAGAPGVSESQLQAYQAVGQGLTTALREYSVHATTTTGTTDCQAAQAAYDSAAGPLVAEMQHQSQTMDDHMSGMGDHHAADLACVADAMITELAHHRAQACAGTDVIAHHAEAAHHIDTMAAWVDHQRSRYEDLAAMSGMMQAHSGSTFTCQAAADGTYTFTQGGTQTHYPDADHSGGPPTPAGGGTTSPCGGAAPTGTPTCPGDWPHPCHDGACTGGGMGMH